MANSAQQIVQKYKKRILQYSQIYSIRKHQKLNNEAHRIHIFHNFWAPIEPEEEYKRLEEKRRSLEEKAKNLEEKARAEKLAIDKKLLVQIPKEENRTHDAGVLPQPKQTEVELFQEEPKKKKRHLFWARSSREHETYSNDRDRRAH